jgi:transcriptional regulator with XRE-family HTH domain
VSDSAAATSSSQTTTSTPTETSAEKHAQAYERELLYSETVEHFRALTAAIGVTQHDLGQRLHVSDARISRIMTGRENLTLKTLADLGWALGMRFEVAAVPLPDRTGTPAENDPPPPRWLHRHAQLIARRVLDAIKAED